MGSSVARWRAGAAIAAATVLSVAAMPGVGQAAQSGALAPGVSYQTFSLTASHGAVQGYAVTVDLHRASVALLHPAAVSARLPVSAMADAQHAIAGVNGDFFNISETHAGVPATNSSDGPEVSGGRALKAAVPDSQRFGPSLPAGTSTRDVIGVGADGRGRLGSLTLRGSVLVPGQRLDLAGVNQYAVSDGGIGAFTSAWGATSRARVVCGSDTSRLDPCSTDTAEVVVRHGIVVSVASAPGAGAIAAGTVVLDGRDAGADALRRLHVGEPALVSYRLDRSTRIPFRFAVGGFPILRDGAPLPDLDNTVSAPRTAAGVSADGRRFFLVTLDGRAELSGGLTVQELALQLHSMGAAFGVNLDGGGSSTIVTRMPGQTSVTVDNNPSDGSERPVANGIGVFTR
ncbi:MAG TPA: phosphodiester glycosidase family protein [Mycobacteriales bacterium]|nr:phosphodiester glycosidase family protein [Mycobacteriales bacterium]